MQRFFLVLGIMFGFTFTFSSFGAEVVVTRAPNTEKTQSRPILTGQWNVLAEFDVVSIGADRSANAITLAVMDLENFGLAASAADEVSTLRVFANDIFVAEAPVVFVSGLAFFEDITIGLPANTRMRLTVMGLVNSVADGADSGASVYVHLREIEVRGKMDVLVVPVEDVVGNRMVVYKSFPTIGVFPTPEGKIGAGQNTVLDFTIGPDWIHGDVSWKKITFQVAPVGCNVAPIDASPGSTGNVALRLPEFGTRLDVASATGAENGVTNGQTGYVSLVLRNEEIVSGFSVRRYRLEIPVRNLSPVVGEAYVSVGIALTETFPAGPGHAFEAVLSEASFVWSDMSDIRHSESTGDWHNGYLVPGLPSDFVTISNGVTLTPPPPPALPTLPAVHEEDFFFPAGEWIFISPVGLPTGFNDFQDALPLNRWAWDASQQMFTLALKRGQPIAIFADQETKVAALTNEREETKISLHSGWNLIGFTAFPKNGRTETSPFEILLTAKNQQVPIVQVAAWSQKERRYLMVGGNDGVFWANAQNVPHIRLGEAFFVYVGFNGGAIPLFNPNEAFDVLAKGAPPLTLNLGGADDKNIVPPPPLPAGPDPRGKKLETWGELKRR